MTDGFPCLIDFVAGFFFGIFIVLQLKYYICKKKSYEKSNNFRVNNSRPCFMQKRL